MTDPIWLKIALSFLVGGVVVAGCTFAAERLGTDIGGIIGGFPSTIAVTLLFMALVVSPTAAAEATTMVPLIVGFNGAFLVGFALLVRRGLGLSLVGALSLWFVLSLTALQLRLTNFIVFLSTFVVMLFLGHYILYNRLKIPVYGSKRVVLARRQLLTRALVSGGVIAAAVYLSKVAGPVSGGVLSVFPAVFISTLIIVYRSNGADFARALTRPLLTSGMVNVVAYAIAVRYFYPVWGITLGTLGAFVVAGMTAYGTYLVIRSPKSGVNKNGSKQTSP
jgi:hypothetical protein